MPDAIQVTGLTKVYGGGLRRRGGQRALDGVDLAVPAGVSFGLVGLNGAGKTTFIKAVLGIVRPGAGTIRVLGGDPESLAVRRRIGYLPERLQLPAAWRPRAFLRSVARLKGLSRPDDEIDRQLCRVSLLDDAGRRIGGFSKGMRQRLGLAAALLGAPDLLILDEPTDGIDPLGRVAVRGILAEERRRGATLFLNSHLLSETERICDRLAVLHQGRIMREGPIEALCDALEGWRVKLAEPEAGTGDTLAYGTTDTPADGTDRDGSAAETGHAAPAAAGLLPDERPGWWRFVGDDVHAFNATLDGLRRAGALVLEVVPVGRDLEALLARVVDGGLSASRDAAEDLEAAGRLDAPAARPDAPAADVNAPPDPPDAPARNPAAPPKGEAA